MGKTGTGFFFDGVTGARRDVAIELAPSALKIRSPAGEELSEWPYIKLEHASAPEHVFRIALRENPNLARLEIFDPEFAHEIDLLAPLIDRTGAEARRAEKRVVGWAIAATAALVLAAIYGVPALAERFASAVPQRLEARLGAVADAQVRAMLDKGPAGRSFECGNHPAEQAGRAAFDKLIARLATAADTRIALKPAVVRRPEANAIALPGGYIYAFQGLIEKANDVDEVAGVIAHEIGHVAHRDGTKALLQGAGLSFLFGTLLGDFIGGGAVVLAANKLLQSAYSRDVETAADIFAVEVMRRLGADARALGRILERIAGGKEPGFSIFLDHPVTRERLAIINAMAPPQSRGAKLLNDAEWTALKRICAGS